MTAPLSIFIIVVTHSILTTNGQLLTCPNNVVADGYCIGGRCGTPNYQCINNVCCRQGAIGQGTCLNGAPASGPCLPNSVCGSGYLCESGLCCPQSGVQQTQCPQGTVQTSTNCAQCPFGSFCQNNVCCSTSTTTGGQCPANYIMTATSCQFGCTSSGSICLNNVCCALNTGPVGASCPAGFTLTGTNCAAGCAFGSQCIQNVCCQPSAVGGTCPAGYQQTTSSCQNGCAFGTQCINNVCCRIGQTTGGQCPAGYTPTSTVCGQCAFGDQCINGICCRTSGVITPSPSLTCPQGHTLTGLCGLSQACPPGSQCYAGGACCRPPIAQTPQCPDRSSPVAMCINGRCGNGFYCYANYCCRSAQNPNVCGGGQPVCPCSTGNQCPQQSSCQPTTNTCCQGYQPTNYAGSNGYGYQPQVGYGGAPYQPPYYPPQTAAPYYPPVTSVPYYPPVTQTPYYPPQQTTGTTLQQLQQQITTYRPVLMYTLSGDALSATAKQILSTYADVRGYYLDIDKSGQQQNVMRALVQLTSRQNLPFVFVCGRYIGSTAELSALHASGQLRAQAQACSVGGSKTKLTYLSRSADLPNNKDENKFEFELIGTTPENATELTSNDSVEQSNGNAKLQANKTKTTTLNRKIHQIMFHTR